jgi:hypothetical protein
MRITKLLASMEDVFLITIKKEHGVIKNSGWLIS